mmetsp:Transcript_15081/g.17071  ORF Transcript_15081/g.17071 Transcript_15081/m.17071 type:complete len:218 (+) Transcript_15081:77-730(+)|eukprot:CAMPEP_0184018876 /NCGR_PEP_ID=MMETSP0954-20121128/8414_1 /TAXON_ID=627963 /ORGANISM="Aplanochytrium sp, Strain PBS07" /LENGTH=217 /DNA_ID=CAMNT_0026300429 /DNA_START=91 /DNA_END=744 /DNA_ORIENTATION=+
MKRIVGKKKKTPAPTLGQAGAKLDSMGDGLDTKLDKERKELKRIKLQLAATKDPRAKQALKKRALPILKRIKMMEGQRENIYAQSFNINQQDFTIASMAATVDTVKAMKGAKKVMKKEIKKIKIDKIEDLKDDIEDIMEDFNEVNEVLGSSAMDDISEGDLDAELAMLDEFDDDMLDEAEAETPAYLSNLDDMAGLPPAPIDTQTPANETPQSIPQI